MRITAACGFPLTWLTNPEVLLFIQEFVHATAVVPTRHTLTRRVLPETLSTLRAERDKSIKKLSYRHGTLQFDGWTALNQHHYDAFMLSLNRQARSVIFSI